MVSESDTTEFIRQADAQGLILRTSDAEEARFVFDLKEGSIVTSAHPRIARQLLLLAESVYAPDRGEARELSRLVARRAELDDDDGDGTVVWRHASRAYAGDPDRYRTEEWIAFGEWLEDQFLLEDAIAKMDEGVPI